LLQLRRRRPARRPGPAPAHPLARKDRTPMADLDLLFSPIKIGHKTAKNRIVSTPHATGYGRDGYPTQRYLDYYAYKAQGGVGVIQPFGSTSVHPSTPSADWGGIHHWHDSIIPWDDGLGDGARHQRASLR